MINDTPDHDCFYVAENMEVTWSGMTLKGVDVEDFIVIKSRNPWWKEIGMTPTAIQFRCTTSAGTDVEFWLSRGCSDIDTIRECDPYGPNLFDIKGIE